MNKCFIPAALVSASLLSACATTETPTIALVDSEHVVDQGRGKIGVAQMGAKQNAEYVFCDGRECPKRTRKLLPAPPLAQKSQPSRLVEPNPLLPVQFKVHFRWGWSRLDKEGQIEVAKVVDAPGLKNAKSIVIAGRTDPTGSRAANEKLALKRAQTVKAALVMAGVPESVITAEAQAPCCDGDKTAAPEVMRELRRTDIDITITK